MSTVEEIKSAIDSLSFEDCCRLMALLNPVPDDDWDREMRADAEAGKFDRLMEESDAKRTGSGLQ